MSQKFHEYKRDALRDDRLRSIPIIGPIIQVGKAIQGRGGFISLFGF